LDLEIGETFGEDGICFGIPNTYSVKVESSSVHIIFTERSDFSRKYKWLISLQANFYKTRRKFIKKIVKKSQTNYRDIKEKFESIVE